MVVLVVDEIANVNIGMEFGRLLCVWFDCKIWLTALVLIDWLIEWTNLRLLDLRFWNWSSSPFFVFRLALNFHAVFCPHLIDSCEFESRTDSFDKLHACMCVCSWTSYVYCVISMFMWRFHVCHSLSLCICEFDALTWWAKINKVKRRKKRKKYEKNVRTFEWIDRVCDLWYLLFWE